MTRFALGLDENVMKFKSLAFVLAMRLCAAEFEPLEFIQKDWMLACDNTGTCKMAGYQSDESDNFVSVMFERKIGEGLKGRFAAYSENLIVGKDDVCELYINGVKKADVKFSIYRVSELGEQAENALLEALFDSRKIEFKLGKVVWRLSNAGYNEVLLRMNTHQGYTKSGVFLKPAPKPIIKAAKVVDEFRIISDNEPEFRRIYKLLQSVSDANECKALFDDGLHSEITVNRLTDELFVVTSLCMADSYNFSSLTILMDANLKEVRRNLGSDFNGYDGGVLSLQHKIREAGDCWRYKEAVWDGKEFKLSKEGTTGLCKGFTDGVWQMDTFVSEVVQ